MSPGAKNYAVLGPKDTIRRRIREEVEEFSENESKKGKVNWNTRHMAYFINENRLTKCPKVEIKIRNVAKIRAILDSGSEVNLLSESMNCYLSQRYRCRCYMYKMWY
jgi:hypothetical protein